MLALENVNMVIHVKKLDTHESKPQMTGEKYRLVRKTLQAKHYQVPELFCGSGHVKVHDTP